MTNKTKGKRQKPSTDTESDDQASQKPSTSQTRETLSKTSRFLVISSLEDNKSICSLSPFVIFKTIKSIAGEPKSIKNLKSGDLLVECERESHIKNLLKTTTFFDIKCQVKLHNTLNSSKGIVRCPALKGCTNEHIVEEMRDQGVLAVRRIQVRRDGQIRPTNTFVFTFNTPELPKMATVGYLRVPVEVYIPNPLRCYRCQMFGHHEDNCSRPAVCVNCGEPQHDTEDSGRCTRTSKCFNCSGNHAANSRDCQFWHKEKEIMKIKYTNNISFQEARQKVEKPVSTSYASVTKSAQVKPSKDAQTQTDPVIITTFTDTNTNGKDSDKNITVTTSQKTEKILKPGTIDMIKRDMARDRQRQRTQTVRKDRTAVDGKLTKASDNPFSVLEDMEDDDSVIFSESPPGVPKGTIIRINPV